MLSSVEHIHLSKQFFPVVRDSITQRLGCAISLEQWSHGVMAAIIATDHSSPIANFPGGVAERLIAPVLKTGRPKGLVSSNLTPSVSLVERA